MKNKFYIECRLYNANSRLINLDLTEMIDKWIDDGMFLNFEHCFLPYRDGGDFTTGQEIFDHDKNAIDASVGIVGYFDDGTYDSGCGWEVGYAFSKGYPINLITTDFLLWSVGDSSEFYSISKLMNYVANVIHITEHDPGVTDYREQNQNIINKSIEKLKQNLLSDFGKSITLKPKLTALPVVYDYYLDPNFMYSEPAQMILIKIQNSITRAGKTYIMGDNKNDIATDIDNLLHSKMGIFYFDAFDPNVDSNILQGIAYGIGRAPITYCSKKQRHQSGEFLNTMITHSASTVVQSFAELEKIIQ